MAKRQAIGGGRRNSVSMVLLAAGTLSYYVLPRFFGNTGRGNLQASFITAGLLLSSLGYFGFGRAHLPFTTWVEAPLKVQDDSFTDVESAALVTLRAEMDVLRQERDQACDHSKAVAAAKPPLLGMHTAEPMPEVMPPQHSVTTLLSDFAHGRQGTGPMSNTGAAQGLVGAAVAANTSPAGALGLSHGQYVFGGSSPAPEGRQVYAPLSAQSHLKRLAGRLLDMLNDAEGQRASNPWWGNAFWTHVETVINDAGSDVPADIRRLLAAHGFVGAATVSPPRETLRQELEALSQTAAPLHGAGYAAFSPQGVPQMEAGAANSYSAWHNSLAPDMRRAAPEIYRSLRSAGAASVRDWINLQYSGSRTADMWSSLWETATAVDFALGEARNDLGLMQVLASNDFVEMGLRSLAAYVYETRTNDKTGARAMRALQTPGSMNDVAPSWLVKESTEHSKVEHQRSERVRGKVKGRGRGRGGSDDAAPDKGRGRGGK